MDTEIDINIVNKHKGVLLKLIKFRSSVMDILDKLDIKYSQESSDTLRRKIEKEVFDLPPSRLGILTDLDIHSCTSDFISINTADIFNSCRSFSNCIDAIGLVIARYEYFIKCLSTLDTLPPIGLYSYWKMVSGYSLRHGCRRSKISHNNFKVSYTKDKYPSSFKIVSYKSGATYYKPNIHIKIGSNYRNIIDNKSALEHLKYKNDYVSVLDMDSNCSKTSRQDIKVFKSKILVRDKEIYKKYRDNYSRFHSEEQSLNYVNIKDVYIAIYQSSERSVTKCADTFERAIKLTDKEILRLSYKNLNIK